VNWPKMPKPSLKNKFIKEIVTSCLEQIASEEAEEDKVDVLLENASTLTVWFAFRLAISVFQNQASFSQRSIRFSSAKVFCLQHSTKADKNPSALVFNFLLLGGGPKSVSMLSFFPTTCI